METIINPKVPCVAPIPRRLSNGTEVKLQGLVPLSSNGFQICLLCNNNEDANIPLNIDINTLNFTLTLNSTLNHEHSQNIILSNIILKRNERFEISIQSHTTQYLILINNHICGHYPKITHMDLASYISITGQVYIERVYSAVIPNGFKHDNRVPPPAYEEVAQHSKVDYGSCPLPAPQHGTIPYPVTSPVATGMAGYQTYLIQTGTYPLQSVTVGPNNHSHPLNARNLRRSNYKTYLGWICIVFFIIIILLAIMFSRSHRQMHPHRHDHFHDQ